MNADSDCLLQQIGSTYLRLGAAPNGALPELTGLDSFVFRATLRGAAKNPFGLGGFPWVAYVKRYASGCFDPRILAARILAVHLREPFGRLREEASVVGPCVCTEAPGHIEAGAT
jgi:hypothetical protein